MEQLIVTPIRPYELILGKAIPFIGLGYINITVVILVGTFWFDVHIGGSLPLLFALTGLFILTCLGMGLVVSTISNTQQQASMAGQFLLLPNMFFSGFMFPIASMPPLVQKLTYLDPAALLHHDRARHLPQGRRLGRAAGRGRRSCSSTAS